MVDVHNVLVLNPLGVLCQNFFRPDYCRHTVLTRGFFQHFHRRLSPYANSENFDYF